MKYRPGDDGKSFLPKMGRLDKNSLCFCVLGDLDELNAQIGVVSNKSGHEQLDEIQKTLMEISSQLATGESHLTEEDLLCLEKWTEEKEQNLPPLNNFIVPSTRPEVHLARAICRRTERNVIGWMEQPTPEPFDFVKFNLVVPYLNRLGAYYSLLQGNLPKGT